MGIKFHSFAIIIYNKYYSIIIKKHTNDIYICIYICVVCIFIYIHISFVCLFCNVPLLTSVNVVPLMKTARVVEKPGHCILLD